MYSTQPSSSVRGQAPEYYRPNRSKMFLVEARDPDIREAKLMNLNLSNLRLSLVRVRPLPNVVRI